MTSPRKTRVAVVFGGRSPEHAISCVSAGNILGALDPDEFEAVPVGITRAGQWVLTSGDPAQLAISGRQLPEITAASGTSVVLSGDPAARGLVVLDPAQFTKKLAVAAGIPTGPYAVLRAGQSLSEDDKRRLGLPVFVKPARAGSSYGITKVSDWAELEVAVAAARAIDPKVLVEQGIVGREIECGVLEGEYGGAPDASLLAEVRVVKDHEFYDFEAKYLDDACEYDIPARLPDALTRQIQDYARRTFVALDCAGLARVDFFLSTDGEVFLNEINTMPGFTSTSMFPRMWAATGLEYPKLISRLIRTALRRGTGLH
ncbi:MAG: D-alanine--D-alanine ligase A [Actinobacteria bacterium 13_2_20CM_2_71_6]|nr:MAG: D-alanine--D-alanine ligase A [Actinobacteria bacterium 13_2_20CM_2_71_6]